MLIIIALPLLGLLSYGVAMLVRKPFHWFSKNEGSPLADMVFGPPGQRQLRQRIIGAMIVIVTTLTLIQLAEVGFDF